MPVPKRSVKRITKPRSRVKARTTKVIPPSPVFGTVDMVTKLTKDRLTVLRFILQHAENGDEPITIHADACEWDGSDESCSCTPLVMQMGAAA